ncbi:helix-turn-helix domain-containing protein [Streptomyces sp. NPDC046909]|uniref:helix-turn-helix domain-containing protein n=1 Tax=Streptomyces sp. NPDC046909 TaxID=3155617 RepID=UPI0033CAFAA4
MTPDPVRELTAAQHAQLVRLSNGTSTPQAQVLRCRIVLAAATGATRAEVARRFGVSAQTVDKWLRRYAVEGLAGLRDRPRPGAPRRIEDAAVAEVLHITRHEPPPFGGNWSKRTLAQRAGVSASTVARIWRAHGITPGVDARPVAPVPGYAAYSEQPPIVPRAIYTNGALSVLALRSTAGPKAVAGLVASPSGSGPAEPSEGAGGGAGHFAAALALLASAAEREPTVGGRPTPGFTALLQRLAMTRQADTELHVICYAGNPAALLALHRWQFEQPRLAVHLTPTRKAWLWVVQDVLAGMEPQAPGSGAREAQAEIETELRAWRCGRGADPFIWERADWPDPVPRAPLTSGPDVKRRSNRSS